MSIPKVIHKILITDNGQLPELPKKFQDAIDTWQEKNPGYTIKLYSGNDCVRYITENYHKSILEAYMKIKPYAFKCDFVRQLILYNEGGWYTDARMVCLQPLDLLYPNNKPICTCIDRPQAYPCMYNGFIGVIPGHPVTQKMIDLIMWNVQHKHHGIDCLQPTGPGGFMNACIDHFRFNEEGYMMGEHVIEDDEQYIKFGEIRMVKVKYNDLKGGDNSDISGGNDYGEMWSNGDVYL